MHVSTVSRYCDRGPITANAYFAHLRQPVKQQLVHLPKQLETQLVQINHALHGLKWGLTFSFN